MFRSRSNSEACSSYRIPISARRAAVSRGAPIYRVARPVVPERNLQEPQLAAVHRREAHPVPVMDGIALASRFTAPVAQRLSPPVVAAGSVRRPPVQPDRPADRGRAVMEATEAEADKRFASARRLSSSGVIRPAIRRRGVQRAEAPSGRPIAARPLGAAVAEQPMRAVAAAAMPAGVVGTQVGDTAKDRL
jgi:hypothetical protein